MNGQNQMPPIQTFLPPPPDEFFATSFSVLTNLILGPGRAVKGALDQLAGTTENVASQVSQFPRK